MRVYDNDNLNKIIKQQNLKEIYLSKIFKFYKKIKKILNLKNFSVILGDDLQAW